MGFSFFSLIPDFYVIVPKYRLGHIKKNRHAIIAHLANSLQVFRHMIVCMPKCCGYDDVTIHNYLNFKCLMIIQKTGM